MKSLRKLPRSPVAKPDRAAIGVTGTWRTSRPVISHEKCEKCMICWLHCPDGVIKKNRKGFPEICYEFCKGCGICATECPTKAIKTEEESRFERD
jgi:2-oxoacid:acceptor oxidoreductase delta subunit (pyruvate/2-ketoisovalerate family)